MTDCTDLLEATRDLDAFRQYFLKSFLSMIVVICHLDFVLILNLKLLLFIEFDELRVSCESFLD